MVLTVSFGKWLMLIKAWVTSLSTNEDNLTPTGDGGGVCVCWGGREGDGGGVCVCWGEGRGMEEVCVFVGGEGRGGGWRRCVCLLGGKGGEGDGGGEMALLAHGHELC